MVKSPFLSSELDSGFCLGSWQVEPRSNTISRQGEDKHLENRLMQTLVFLAAHQGEVVSREQFFDSVWQGRVVNEEALSRAISLLRTALDDNAQSPEFIQTIPGVGYRLIAKPVISLTPEEAPSSTKPTSESSPDSIGREMDVRDGESNAPEIGVGVFRVIIVTVALFLGLFAIYALLLEPARERANVKSMTERERNLGSGELITENSLAVLPFVNMSSDPNEEYFADGMTEELLNLLASVPKLRVTARTSSFFFKGKSQPVSQIADALNVKHILEGSIRRSGGKVRITAQLIEAQSDRHLWSQSYDREMADIFTIQDEVAAAIVALLVDSFDEPKLNPDSRTKSLAAFEAYRTGRLRWWRRSIPELHQSIDLFTQAIEHDPGFAPAYAALADSSMLLVLYGDMHITEGEEIAEGMVEKALELDPESAEAYAALGLSRLVVGRKLEGETALRMAIDLDPAYIPAYVWLSALLSDLGRVPEEGAELLEAMSMDPLNELLTINYAENLQVRGDNEGAKSTLESLIRLQPKHTGLLSSLSGVALKSGNLVEAWTAAKQAYDLEPENVVVIIGMATAWMELGEFAEAEKVWLAGIEQNRGSIEVKIQYLTMLITEGRVADAERLFPRIFGDDISQLQKGYQRTYHYFMGLLSDVKGDIAATRDHFELVIDPSQDQLFDRDQILILTTTSLINSQLGANDTAEEQLLTAERVVGHARVDGIDNSDIYYSAAGLFALRSDKGQALRTLQQAYDRGFRQIWKLKRDRYMDILRKEPAFAAIQTNIANEIKQARMKVRGLITSANQPTDKLGSE